MGWKSKWGNSVCAYRRDRIDGGNDDYECDCVGDDGDDDDDDDTFSVQINK